MNKKRTISIVESAVMIALAVILSMIEVVKMPFGGGITAAAMLPIVLIAYRHKNKWGILTAFVYGLLQLLLGLGNLQYATTFAAACAIIFLDYILAFGVLGFAGIFRGKLNSQSAELTLGILISCFLRYVLHVICGCTVWAGVSIPTADGLIYSLAYNAAYMIPETIITLGAAWYLSKYINFRSEKLVPNFDKQDKVPAILNGIGILALLVGIMIDALYLFSHMQTEEGFDITAISTVNPVLLLSVIIIVAVIWAILYFVSKKLRSKA